MTGTNSSGIWEWTLVRLILLLSILLFGLFIAVEGYTEEGIRLIISWTAKISVTCFCIAFAGKYIHQLVQNSFSFWLYMNRKYWGITFALIHLLLGFCDYAGGCFVASFV